MHMNWLTFYQCIVEQMIRPYNYMLLAQLVSWDTTLHLRRSDYELWSLNTNRFDSKHSYA